MTNKAKRVGDLVIDDKLTELRPVNLYFVSRYRQAARCGAVFPPLIVEKGTNRVVSGNHRLTMYLEEFGEDHEIDVIEQKFADEAAVIRTFAEENCRHGAPLSGYSQKYIAQKLLEYGDNPETIAQVLNIPVKKVQNFGGMNFVVVGPNKKKERKPIKHGLEHKAGSTVQLRDYETHKKHDRGVPAKTQADQLIRWIENGWIDTEDTGTMDNLWILYNTLGVMFKKHRAG